MAAGLKLGHDIVKKDEKMSSSKLRVATAIVTLGVCGSSSLANAQERPAPDTDAGIASRYVGDREISDDPDVVFVENFEQGSLEGIGSRWDSRWWTSGVHRCNEVPNFFEFDLLEGELIAIT